MGLSISRHMQKFPPNWLKTGVKKLYVDIQKDFSHVRNEAGFVKDVTLIDLESLQGNDVYFVNSRFCFFIGIIKFTCVTKKFAAGDCLEHCLEFRFI